MTENIPISAPSEERLTLRKSAKLRHRTLIRQLFDEGKSVYAGPLRFTFRPLSEEDLANAFRNDVPDLIGPVQIMITVPKKKRRHAVHRVLMRRRIREAFRLQHRPLRHLVETNATIRSLSIAIVYMQSENTDMKLISSAMSYALSKIYKKISSHQINPEAAITPNIPTESALATDHE